MITLQSHNQVLYHLTQLTSAVNPRSTPLATNVKKQNDVACENTDNFCYHSFAEAVKNCTELPILQLNTHNVGTIHKTKKNNVSMTVDFSINASEQSSSKKSKWKVSYVSGSSFTENKQEFPCSQLTEPIILSAIYLSSRQQCRLFRNLYSKSFFNYDVQTRSFKTQRNVKEELDRNPSISARIKKWFGQSFGANMGSKLVFGNEPREADTEKIKYLFNDTKTEEQTRIKTAFAEGYEAGLHRQMRGKKLWVKILQNGFLAIILFLGIGMIVNTAGGMFRIRIGGKSEVDPEEIHVTFNDVKGVDEAKQELKDVVEFLKNPDKFTALGGKLPKGVLLVGSPGTGKTLLARAVAGEANVPFFHAAGPEFDEILVGQGARRVRDLFRAAKEKAPCVVFIDEIDSVGAKRTNSVLHPYANQTINQLLSEMDGFHQNEGVIVLGATNRRDDLDKALMRPGRFDVEILVKTPDYLGRKEILDLYLGRILTCDVDAEYLARGTTGFTGADIENMVNQAALRAAIEGADYVTMKHVEYAKDKVLMGPEIKSKVADEEINRITAYHEGGHAIVALYTKDSDPIHKVTIIPRGFSLGHTAYIPEKDNLLQTKSHLLAKMDCIMGGRAAEELIFGPERITTGAASDFAQATRIAESMVKTYGMSDKVGFRSHVDTKDGVFNSEYGPSTNELIDNEIKRLLQESYERAKTILKTHSKEHKQLADALLKYETLDAEDVKAIVTGKKTHVETANNKIPIIDVTNKNVM